MMKRVIFGSALALAAATISVGAQRGPQIVPKLTGFDVVEATIYQMQTAMQRGQVSSKELVLQSFARVASTRTCSTPSLR